MVALFLLLVLLRAVISDYDYFGIVYSNDSSASNTYDAAAVNFTNNNTIQIGNLFNSIKRSSGCYQTETTYFWTYYGTDLFTNISVTSVYTVDIASGLYEFVSFPNKSINYYCLQLIDFPSGAVTVSYNPLNNYEMNVFWVFESPIEHKANPFQMPLSKEFIEKNYTLTTGIAQNFNNIIIFYSYSNNISNTDTDLYKYAMYDSELNMIEISGNANCQFGNGIIELYYTGNLEYYSYFITKDNSYWYVGQLNFDQNNLNVTSCEYVYKFNEISTKDEYYSGDINDEQAIVILTSSGIYLIDFAEKQTKTVQLNVDTSILGSINFAPV